MKHNFSAGPSILPQEVFKEASEAILNFNGSGLSILEMSHRSKAFMAVLDEAVALVKELLEVPDSHEVLFLSGGASSQFFISALNLLRSGETAYYLNTGIWSTKAIKEAKIYGQIIELASSADKNFTYLPKGYSLPNDAKYFHYTSNNTIFGTQFQEPPDVNVPLVADMSSDIFSKPIDLSCYDCIYAGAQKNMGPAGTTLVIIRKGALREGTKGIPSMLNYQIHIDKGSLFNTPPVFPIYGSMLTLRWLKSQGGVNEINKRNIAKAELFYNEIDTNPLFYNPIEKEDRSIMNATFFLKDSLLDEEFNRMCQESDLIGLPGHRSVGGYRASMYNAMDIKSVKALVDVMQDLARKNV